jgi:hypothetical protein
MPWLKSRPDWPSLAVVLGQIIKPMEKGNMDVFGRALRVKTYFVAIFWN